MTDEQPGNLSSTLSLKIGNVRNIYNDNIKNVNYVARHFKLEDLAEKLANAL